MVANCVVEVRVKILLISIIIISIVVRLCSLIACDRPVRCHEHITRGVIARLLIGTLRLVSFFTF